jgi:hypothetical protein
MTDDPKYQAGNLILWTDYTKHPPLPHVGLLLRLEPKAGKLVVLNQGVETQWYSWQCEVLNEDR